MNTELGCICFLFFKMYFMIKITNNINGDIDEEYKFVDRWIKNYGMSYFK